MDNLSTKQWALLLAGSLGLATLNIFVLQILIVGIIAGALTGTVVSQFVISLASGQKVKAIEAAKIDGRTQEEWYEIVSGLGREEYERLSRPALDGLEGSKEGYGGWDIEKLMGRVYFKKLRRQWYPEKHCKYCEAFTDGIPGNCDWDGPCHDFQIYYKLEQKNKSYKAITDKKKEKLVVKGPIRASITKDDTQKELDKIEADLLKWQRDFARAEAKYNKTISKWAEQS